MLFSTFLWGHNCQEDNISDSDKHLIRELTAGIKTVESCLISPTGMVSTYALITPEIAKKWLEKNNCNRPMRSWVVNAYARDMHMSVWELTPTSVCFLPVNEGGGLGNSQHTLSAIIKSDKERWLKVTFNVPKSVIAVMDLGHSRTVKDLCTLLGQDVVDGFDSHRARVADICCNGYRTIYNKKKTFNEKLAMYQAHEEAIEFAMSLVPEKKGIVPPAVLGLIARAYYTRPKERLVEFISVIRSGITTSLEDVAAIKFQRWHSEFTGSGGMMAYLETYRKGQAALIAFLDKKRIEKLYGEKFVDSFPVPDLYKGQADDIEGKVAVDFHDVAVNGGPAHKPWTGTDKLLLVKYKRKGWAHNRIAGRLDRTLGSIDGMIKQLGVGDLADEVSFTLPSNDRRKWTPDDLRTLATLADGTRSAVQIAKIIGRTPASVQQRLMRAGISLKGDVNETDALFRVLGDIASSMV